MLNLIFLLLFSGPVFSAMNCDSVKPFRAFKKGQSFKIEATQLLWKKTESGMAEESLEICRIEGKIEAFDIRGREEEALACLKPDKGTVYSCETTLSGKPAKIYFIPSIWVRDWNSKKAREYRFHALVKSDAKADLYLDVFARTISYNIKAADIVTEGAIKSGPLGNFEGYFVRAQFQK